jgi:hypothetical protein
MEKIVDIRIALSEFLRRSGLSLKRLEESTEISRQTWSKLLNGNTRPRLFHGLVLNALRGKADADGTLKAREPWQRLAFPAPRCSKCGSRMQRVRRKIMDGETLYAWRCSKARLRECDTQRIWTNSAGVRVERPSHKCRPTKNVGVTRPTCECCNHRMAFIGKKSHPIFGSLWKWRCVGTTGKAHKTFQVATDYSGERVRLPRVRSWGTKLLPFERKLVDEIPVRNRMQKWTGVLRNCEKCGKTLEADRRGPQKWRLHCNEGCIEPYFVNDRGTRIRVRRASVARLLLPKKARHCPQCGGFLSMSGATWRKRRLTPHGEQILRLICIEQGKRRHPGATFYFDRIKKKFLNPKLMRPGQPSRECRVRKRCCNRPMWVTYRAATNREPEHWFQSCANPSCTKGRGGGRRHLKIGVDGRPLQWLKPKAKHPVLPKLRPEQDASEAHTHS